MADRPPAAAIWSEVTAVAKPAMPRSGVSLDSGDGLGALTNVRLLAA